MSVEEIVNSCSGYVETDVARLFEAIRSIDDGDASAIAALRPCPLALAALYARRPSGIIVARTFHGSAQPRSAELRCPPRHYMMTIVLSDTNVSVANNGVVVFGGRVAAGTACVTAPGERMVVLSETFCDLLHLAIPARFMLQPTSRFSELGGLVVRDFELRRIARLLCEGPAAWLRVYADLLSQLAVARLLQLAPRSPLSCLQAWRLKKVQAFVDTNIDRPLRLSDLAAVAGLSRMHFASKFRAATGMRPHDYVLSRRVARAKQLIATEDSTLVTIALDAGFQSQAHFCTVFKRFIGMAPSMWRQQLSLARDLQNGNLSAPCSAEIVSAAALAPLSFAFHAASLRADARST